MATTGLVTTYTIHHVVFDARWGSTYVLRDRPPYP